MTTPTVRRHAPRGRRGSALVLVLIMTLSLAGLAISAIYLSSSAGLLTRYYDRERDYRYGSEAALALGKSRVNKDGTLGLPEDTAKLIISAGTLTDASGTAVPRIKVNLYGAFTGDTVGRFGAYVTLLASAFDSGGTRHVRRLDLTAESFSRYAMFVDTFPSGLSYGNGEFIRGRAHSNQSWYSSGSPGPTYYDTVSVVGTVNGTATYTFPSRTGVTRIPFPTVTKLAALPGYSTAANLNFTPVTGAAASAAVTQSGVNLSGQMGAGNPVKGSRLRFRPVDVNSDGSIQEAEGMMMVFDLATGMDTSTLRVDLPRSGSTAVTNVVILNQCGLMVKISGRNEFFPVARFREQWVRARVIGQQTSNASATITAADTNTMRDTTATGISKIMSFGVPNSRCFPPGSPYLMLTERHVEGAACTVSTSTAVTPYAWGAAAAGCAASTRYGGQDTTFTATVTRCNQRGTVGLCAGNQVTLGSWRTWGGAALPGISASVIQAVEVPYLWPLFKPYNLNSKGVITSTTGPLYLSDTLRGNVTIYMPDTTKDAVFIDDLVYDVNPTVASALCRNFLGVIAGRNVYTADNALNRPRPDASGTFRMFGTPHFTLHGVTLSLKGTVGVENYSGNQVVSAAGGGAITCGAGYPTSGGCINQSGGVIERRITATYAGNNTGLRENRTVDPCQNTNRKPPFFPMTGRYVDNKYYEIDPVNVDTWTEVKNFYARLRGRSAP